MANLGDIQNLTESLSSDQYLMRQGTTDGKMKRDVIFDMTYPAGTVVLLSSGFDPGSIGYPGTWTKLEAERGSLATATALNSDIGTFTGMSSIPVELVGHTHTTTTSTNGLHTHNSETVPSSLNLDAYDISDAVRPTGSLLTSNATSSGSGSHTHIVSVGDAGVSEQLTTRQKAKKIFYWLRVS